MTARTLVNLPERQKIAGVNHVTLAVKNVEQSLRFYSGVLGLKPVARWRMGAYLIAGQDWIALTLDAQTRTASLPEYTHLAFTVSEDDFLVTVERLRVAMAEIWQENRSPGQSFYFLDPNGHKLEIHTSTLEARMLALQANPPQDLFIYP